MIDRFLAAAVQMSSGPDKALNLAEAERLVRAAVAAGAELVVLPELFNCLGRPDVMLAEAEEIPGPTSRLLARLAHELNITLVGGSFCERQPGQNKALNTSLVFDAGGRELARYRKLHLFDVDLAGHAPLRESSWLDPGQDVVVVDAPQARVGMAICYDLRFGGLFEHLSTAGAEVIVLPSAFTAHTGRDHWEVLIRARAIENQSFIIAADQFGPEGESVATRWGHSMIVDPWGNVLACAERDEATFVIAALERSRLDEIRARLPALRHRRTLRGASSQRTAR